MIELLTSPEAWVSLLVLSVMEIVLGIDNIVFITILCGRLPRERQLSARRLGLGVALISRLGLLLGISWVMRLQDELFTLVIPWTGKNLILATGQLELVYTEGKKDDDDEWGGRLLAGIVGALANGTAMYLERADTRAWSLLPGQVSLVRVRVPAGTRDVTVRVGDATALRLKVLRAIHGEGSFCDFCDAEPAEQPAHVDLAVEDGFGADGELLLAPALVEEGDLEPARLVGDVAGDHGATALDPPRRDRPHGREHHALLARAEIAHLGLVGAVEVSPRVVREEVEERVDAQLVETVELLRADSAQPLDGDGGQIGERDRRGVGRSGTSHGDRAPRFPTAARARRPPR